jgi:RecJ-like exonuclease
MTATCLNCGGDGEVANGLDCPLCEGSGECDCGLCDSCISAAEAAYERQCEDFYGGSGPLTMDEQHRTAWLQKQELRR